MGEISPHNKLRQVKVLIPPLCGEMRKLARSRHKNWSDVYRAVGTIKLKTYYRTVSEYIDCCVGYE